ncbi:MAG TPA: IgGFc-binding protein, partial [Candidatus Kapabacteria bacterium]|nr:IgGFc-binding protein [Candidatus Kapabacteria bacterium]
MASLCRAQVTSAGTDYWLGFMPNGDPGTTNVQEELFIASALDNSVTITIPGIGQQTISIAAGQVFDYNVSGSMTAVPETPTDNAIHITSTNPVTVYGYSDWDNGGGVGSSPDGYLGLPTTAYGMKYYTMNFPDNNAFGNMPGEFLIISPYDTNVVTITPAANTMTGRLAGTPWSVMLSKGQTYLVQSPGTDWGSNDLTGSQITSTKPIAVITGHQISSVPAVGPTSADHLIEMIPSVDKWGTQYFDMPMAGRTIAGDYIRVLSGENGNQITYNGAGPLQLDSGQYADITNQTVPMVFTSTNHRKFIVAQYSYSQGWDNDPALSDPFMVLFTPQEQFEKEMVFRTPTSVHGVFTNYVTFISLNDSLGKIKINGLPIANYTSAGAAVFSGTNPLMGAMRILLPAGQLDFVASGPMPFGAYQYGFSDFEGYGWPAGMAQKITSPDT